MNREDYYRSSAAKALKLAIHAKCIADKSRLLAMAEAWLDLADRTQKVAGLREIEKLLHSNAIGLAGVRKYVV